MMSVKTMAASSVSKAQRSSRSRATPAPVKPSVKTCAYAPQAPVQDDTPALNLLDMAMNTVLNLFDKPSQDATSEELLLPPELKAYLEEIEKQEGGGHGGSWVHSHIAERLASTQSASDM